ncbi:NAD(P)-binding protein [Wolfiporia cocos MD-104 SS10]|uniref:NAD(P)-binding protein n=1 Tax=Wolfiporia cocos (strain MD-104) TaxID=742152 RepID=A0A2H3JEL9_WOLCO|nr:NAD(P)-binding protein [Wolfiporia cocos MD-104 SS10]
MSSRTAHDSLKTVALFGATGMLGSAILAALLEPSIGKYKPNVVAFMHPGKSLEESLLARHPQLRMVECDYPKGGPEMVDHLRGVDAVVSVLNGPGVAAQYIILDAAIDAGVKRFYPSEYGFHHAYRAPGDPGARIAPLWDEKERFAIHLKLHPAVETGKIEYIHSLEPKPEPFWCPWAQDCETYQVPIVGDGDTVADWSCTNDIARYVVATLSKPHLSANVYLNFPSETISQNAMVELFRKYAKGRKVDVRSFSLDDAHRSVANPDAAPKEIGEQSAIPVNFYFIVKSIQGSGTFRRPRWECHWNLFPEVRRSTFEDYVKERFGPLS